MEEIQESKEQSSTKSEKEPNDEVVAIDIQEETEKSPTEKGNTKKKEIIEEVEESVEDITKQQPKVEEKEENKSESSTDTIQVVVKQPLDTQPVKEETPVELENPQNEKIVETPPQIKENIGEKAETKEEDEIVIKDTIISQKNQDDEIENITDMKVEPKEESLIQKIDKKGVIKEEKPKKIKSKKPKQKKSRIDKKQKAKKTKRKRKRNNKQEKIVKTKRKQKKKPKFASHLRDKKQDKKLKTQRKKSKESEIKNEEKSQKIEILPDLNEDSDNIKKSIETEEVSLNIKPNNNKKSEEDDKDVTKDIKTDEDEEDDENFEEKPINFDTSFLTPLEDYIPLSSTDIVFNWFSKCHQFYLHIKKEPILKRVLFFLFAVKIMSYFISFIFYITDEDLSIRRVADFSNKLSLYVNRAIPFIKQKLGGVQPLKISKRTNKRIRDVSMLQNETGKLGKLIKNLIETHGQHLIE